MDDDIQFLLLNTRFFREIDGMKEGKCPVVIEFKDDGENLPSHPDFIIADGICTGTLAAADNSKP